jgi:hypothetical protein
MFPSGRTGGIGSPKFSGFLLLIPAEELWFERSCFTKLEPAMHLDRTLTYTARIREMPRGERCTVVYYYSLGAGDRRDYR